MSNRTRPYAYTFRVTENERKIIDEKIKSSGLTMTAFIIKAITNKPTARHFDRFFFQLFFIMLFGIFQ